jgi:formate dehydrogenase major subunit
MGSTASARIGRRQQGDPPVAPVDIDVQGDFMNAPMSRRQFFRICAAGMGSSSVVGLGLSPGAALADVRAFKLDRTTETRGTCPYCSVSCGVIMYSLGDRAKNVRGRIIHIEGDPDHPINRGTLCPKGAALLDFVHSPNRLLYPEVREAGGKEWKRISWDEALDRVAKHLKDDRDANFIEKNDKGEIVNRWNTTSFLIASSMTNEAGYLAVKTARAMGVTAIDTQARI